jgi:hypothetical protein
VSRNEPIATIKDTDFAVARGTVIVPPKAKHAAALATREVAAENGSSRYLVTYLLFCARWFRRNSKSLLADSVVLVVNAPPCPRRMIIHVWCFECLVTITQEGFEFKRPIPMSLNLKMEKSHIRLVVSVLVLAD